MLIALTPEGKRAIEEYRKKHNLFPFEVNEVYEAEELWNGWKVKGLKNSFGIDFIVPEEYATVVS